MLITSLIEIDRILAGGPGSGRHPYGSGFRELSNGYKIAKFGSYTLSKAPGDTPYILRNRSGALAYLSVGLQDTRRSDDTLRIGWVGTAMQGGDPNALGTKLMARVLRVLLSNYPSVNYLSGNRISGARKEAKEILIKVPDKWKSLKAAAVLLCGGPGSGPNAPCPQCGPHKYEDGDRVRFKQGTKFITQGGAKLEPSANSVHRIINVLPRVGNADQMVAVQSEEDQKEGKFGQFGYAKADDLILHEPRQTYQPWQKPEPGTLSKKGFYEPKLDKQGFVVAPEAKERGIPSTQKLGVTRTADGARLTVLKPQTPEEKDPKTLRTISERPHSLKGDFGLQSKVDGVQGTTRIYSTTAVPAYAQEKRSTTVWVNSNVDGGKVKGVTVREQNTIKHAETTSTLTFRYTGAASALGMLKTRYGIKLTMKRLRGEG